MSTLSCCGIVLPAIVERGSGEIVSLEGTVCRLPLGVGCCLLVGTVPAIELPGGLFVSIVGDCVGCMSTLLGGRVGIGVCVKVDSVAGRAVNCGFSDSASCLGIDSSVGTSPDDIFCWSLCGSAGSARDDFGEGITDCAGAPAVPESCALLVSFGGFGEVGDGCRSCPGLVAWSLGRGSECGSAVTSPGCSPPADSCSPTRGDGVPSLLERGMPSLLEGGMPSPSEGGMPLPLEGGMPSPLAGETTLPSERDLPSPLDEDPVSSHGFTSSLPAPDIGSFVLDFGVTCSESIPDASSCAAFELPKGWLAWSVSPIAAPELRRDATNFAAANASTESSLDDSPSSALYVLSRNSAGMEYAGTGMPNNFGRSLSFSSSVNGRLVVTSIRAASPSPSSLSSAAFSEV